MFAGRLEFRNVGIFKVVSLQSFTWLELKVHWNVWISHSVDFQSCQSSKFYVARVESPPKFVNFSFCWFSKLSVFKVLRGSSWKSTEICEFLNLLIFEFVAYTDIVHSVYKRSSHWDEFCVYAGGFTAVFDRVKSYGGGFRNVSWCSRMDWACLLMIWSILDRCRNTLMIYITTNMVMMIDTMLIPIMIRFATKTCLMTPE